MYSILILGGASLIGRNLVRYLVENGLAKKIRVVDRVLLETGYFSPLCLKAFKEVEYIQCNLNHKDNIKKAFEFEDGAWDIVINAALGAKRAQPKEIYEERILNLSINVATEAITHNTKCLIHISNCQVYPVKKSPSKEEDELKGACLFSQYFVKAEKEILKLDNLNAIILRPALCYGPSDTENLTPIMVLARVYQHLDEPMPSLWKKDFKFNLIHVMDFVRAIYHVAKWYIEGDVKGIEVFNVTDDADTETSKLLAIVADIFKIKTESLSSVILNFLKSNLDQFLEDANEKHIEPWAELLKQHGIYNSPLIPYIDQELFSLTPIWMDSSKIKTITQFKVEHPKVTPELLIQVIQEFIEMKLWPVNSKFKFGSRVKSYVSY